MAKNPYGANKNRNCEWGSKGRKEEDKLRGASHKATVEAIAEQLEDN